MTMDPDSPAAPRRSRPVTQKQIAEHLGLSQSLVAEALGGHPKISAATREKVEQGARALGYNPNDNRAARNLVARRHGRAVRQDIIAVVTPEVDWKGAHLSRTPFFMPYVAGVQSEAARRGIDVFNCSPHQGKLPRLLSQGGVDGIIVLGGGSRNCAALDTLELPRVELGDFTEGRYSLTWDETTGAKQAAEHLLALGHRNVAYIGLELWVANSRDRRDAFAAAVARAGGHLFTSAVGGEYCSPDQATGREGAEKLLGSGAHFTAVFCYNDLMAMGAIRCFEERGFKVPRDVSVVGFDDVSLFYGFTPGITSIGFDRLAMGEQAVTRLLEAVDAGELAPWGTSWEVFPTQVVERDSTAPL